MVPGWSSGIPLYLTQHFSSLTNKHQLLQGVELKQVTSLIRYHLFILSKVFSLYDVLDIDDDQGGLQSAPTEAAVKGQDGLLSSRQKAIGNMQLYT